MPLDLHNIFFYRKSCEDHLNIWNMETSYQKQYLVVVLEIDITICIKRPSPPQKKKQTEVDSQRSTIIRLEYCCPISGFKKTEMVISWKLQCRAEHTGYADRYASCAQPPECVLGLPPTPHFMVGNPRLGTSHKIFRSSPVSRVSPTSVSPYAVPPGAASSGGGYTPRP